MPDGGIEARKDAEQARAVHECPRCGRDHGLLDFRPFNQPFSVAGEMFSWWATCPFTEDPVLGRLAWEVG